MHRKRGQSPCTCTETHRICLAFAVPHCTFSAVRPYLQKRPRGYPHISSSSRSTVGSAGADDKTCEGLGAQGFCTQGRTAQGYAGRPKWRGRRDTASGGGIAPPPSPCAPCAHAGRTRVGSTTPPCPREAPGAPASRVASAPEPRTLSEWRAVWREASGHRHHKLDSGVGRYRDVGAGRRDHARGSLRREADREHLSVRIHDPLPPRVMRTERLRWPRPEPAVPRPSRTPPPPNLTVRMRRSARDRQGDPAPAGRHGAGRGGGARRPDGPRVGADGRHAPVARARAGRVHPDRAPPLLGVSPATSARRRHLCGRLREGSAVGPHQHGPPARRSLPSAYPVPRLSC